MALTWNPSLATGVPSVDNQHKEIFRQAALLKEAMSQGKGRTEIAGLLDFLQGYVLKHFADEELAMEQRACRVAAENKVAHAAFLSTLKDYRQRFDAAGANASLVLDIHDAVCRWLTSHIQAIDTKLGQA